MPQYVVTGYTGELLRMSKVDGILYHGRGSASIFPDRKYAEATIRTTQKYARTHNWTPQNAPAWFGQRLQLVKEV